MGVNSTWSSSPCLAALITISYSNANICRCNGLTSSPSIPPTALTATSPIARPSFFFSNYSGHSPSSESDIRSWLHQSSSFSVTFPVDSSDSTPHRNFAYFDFGSSQLLLSSDTFIANNEPENPSPWTDQIIQLSKQKSNNTSKSKNAVKADKVERILDSSTIRLQSGGNISLQTVRGAGSTYRLPECMTYAPAYKLKQLLPKGTNVRYFSLAGENYGENDATTSNKNKSDGGGNGRSNTPKVWIVRDQDDLIVNRELVKLGYAFVRKGSQSTSTSVQSRSNSFEEIMLKELNQLEKDAKNQGLGIFKVCNEDDSVATSTTTADAMTTTSSNSAAFVAEFEPLEYTTITQWGDDGGKSVLVPRESYLQSNPPPNPGDVKGCSDFETYEEALSWYEKYVPYYGDVAKLDRDGDGVPCPGLPHTNVRERYRMKRPNGSAGVGRSETARNEDGLR